MEMCWTAASELGPRSWMSPMWRDIEDADAGAHGHVLGDEAGVLDGHVPAAEVDHLRAQAAVGGVECGLAECWRRGGGGHGAGVLWEGLANRLG